MWLQRREVRICGRYCHDCTCGLLTICGTSSRTNPQNNEREYTARANPHTANATRDWRSRSIQPGGDGLASLVDLLFVFVPTDSFVIFVTFVVELSVGHIVKQAP